MEAEARMLYYRLLARLLGVPPQGWDRHRLADILSGLEGPGHLKRACSSLERSLRSFPEADLIEEYHRLFVGLGRGEVLPYGSWYLSGQLMGRFLVGLRSHLARLGIERQPEAKEPEDHAACLLESMALLLDTESQNLGWETASFFQERIAPWMERFLIDLKGAPSAAFFAAAAETGHSFLLEEKKHWGAWQAAALGE